MELTRKELSALLGVSLYTVNAWVNAGLPCRHIKGQRESRFDRQVVAKWLWDQKKLKYAKKMADPVETPKAKTSRRSVPASGAITSLDQARKLVADAYAMYEEAPNQEKAFCMELWTKLSDNLRKIEKDDPDIQRAKGELVHRAEVERTFAEVGTAIKNDMLAIPGKLAGQLEMMPAGEIQIRLREAIEDALRHLAQGVGSGTD